ncbi:MAG: hypothetical protein ILP09_04170 [Oscillospiraceae bacterium]|nr:hypothetical protein [Oscillospiraceae bacterium]
MKKTLCMLLALCMIFALAACGGADRGGEQEPADGGASAPQQETGEWKREGVFVDENENLLSVIWMDDVDEPGWYVGCMLGEDWLEDSYGGIIPQEGNALHGELPSSAEKEPLTVTVSEDGEDGLLLVVDGGESYHFTALPEATIFVSINVEGEGNIEYAEGEEAPEIDKDYPYQSAQVNLAEPEVYTIEAWPDAGNVFVKWTKNGEDFSAEERITVLLDESADFVAVFEEDPDWQNPVMNFIGEYRCDRAHALVECFGKEEAWITIEWGSSAWENARWDIFGKFDPDTLTVEYEGCRKSVIVYGDDGEIKSEETEYEDGTGTIVFNYDELSFTWHEDQSEYGTDMVFEWIPVTE